MMAVERERRNIGNKYKKHLGGLLCFKRKPLPVYLENVNFIVLTMH